jgi:uncharacterized repeat protein (TIGR01451 family)
LNRIMFGVICLSAGSAAVALAASPGRRQVRQLAPEVAEKMPRPKSLYDMNGMLGGRRVLPMDAAQPPLLIETNVGQGDPGFAFVLRSVNFAVGFTKGGITAVVTSSRSHELEPTAKSGHAIGLQFRGAKTKTLAGADPVKASVNVFRGKGSSKYQRQIPSFKSAIYDDLYPGVQMAVTGSGGKLAYAFRLEPAADLSDIQIDLKGVSSLALDSKGNLRMNTGNGTIVQTKPRFTEIGPGGSRKVRGQFVIRGKTSYGFTVDRRTPGTRLDIDPVINFATYFGGSKNEGTLASEGGASDLHGAGFDIAVGPNANAYVTGTTLSTDFPLTVTGPVKASTDAFSLRLDPSRLPGDWLVYSTVVGGTGFDRGVAVTPTADGSVYITGCTSSSDFPTSAGVVQPTRDESVGYIVRLTPAGAFDLGTIVGRKVVHHPASIAYADGFVYLAGSVVKPSEGTVSETVAGAFQTTYKGGAYDGFVAKLDAGLTHFEYLTLLGGTGTDIVRDLAVTNDGYAYVTGATASTDFPTTKGDTLFQTHSQAARTDCGTSKPPRECFDAFVTRIQQDGTALKYSTFYYVEDGNREEYGRGIAVGTDKRATMTGGAKFTNSSATEIVVVRLDAGGDNKTWEKRLPGLGFDHGEEVVVDALNRAHVVGTSKKDGLVTGSGASFHGGKSDIFYARLLGPDGAVDYLTYLGGSGEDRGFAVAAEGISTDDFCAWLVGSTTSQDVATVNPLAGSEENRGGADVLVHLLCDRPIIIEKGGFHKYPESQTVAAGADVKFTIAITNGGDAPGWVTIKDALPAELTLKSVSCAGCIINGNSFTCNFQVNPGAFACDVYARATNKCPLDNIKNTATLTYGDRTFSSTAKVKILCTPNCPDGVVNSGEKCDDGNLSNSDDCLNVCVKPWCGDGFIWLGKEDCDDGNSSNADNCSDLCEFTVGLNGDCSSDTAMCQGALVCGKHCVNIPGGLFQSDQTLCDNWQCMPKGEADRIKH